MATDEIAAQTGQYVLANGINIYYEVHGDGSPLLLLHGGIVNLSMWTSHIPIFAEHFRVFALDSRGHGRTKNPVDTLSYRLLADDVAAFIHALGLDQPAICGYSDGGQIALEMGMHYPHLASAYVIAGAAHRWTDVYFAWTKALGMERRGVVNLEHFERNQAGLLATIRQQQDAVQGHDYWKIYLQQLSMMWLDPLHYTANDLQRLIAPTLLMGGDRDPFLPAELAVELYRFIPHAELALLPGADHSFPFVQADLFRQLTVNFLVRQQIPTVS
jgi:pimeloyl-ACP methyl ester carboxylesterase